MSDSLEQLIKLVRLNGLEIEIVYSCPPCFLPQSKEYPKCNYTDCNRKVDVVMENFPLCEKHANVLFDSFVPPDKRATEKPIYF